MRSKEAKALKKFANTYLTRRVLFFNEQVAFALTHELDTKSMILGVCHDELALNLRQLQGFKQPVATQHNGDIPHCIRS